MNYSVLRIRRITLPLLAWALLLAPAIATSATQNTSPNDTALNSDAIIAKFGSYGVDIIRQDENVRVSSLYSRTGGAKTTRTLAIVLFAGASLDSVANEHEEIADGASIGETFRDAGWQIRKSNLYLGELRGSGGETLIDTWLGNSGTAIFAIHVYDLFVTKDAQSLKYATIAEIHDDSYLTLAELTERYSDEASQLQRLDSWNAEALRAVFTELNR
jgi:hypothetical protein